MSHPLVLTSTKGISEAYAINNTVTVNESDIWIGNNTSKVWSIRPIVNNMPGMEFRFTLQNNKAQPVGSIGFSGSQRKWCGLGLGQQIQIEEDKSVTEASIASIELNFLKQADAKTYGDTHFNADQMSDQFRATFIDHVFTIGQPAIFEFNMTSGQKTVPVRFSTKILKLESYSTAGHTSSRKLDMSSVKSVASNSAKISANTGISFQASVSSPLMLSGKAQNLQAKQNMIINPEFDFATMGIGGLGDEFKEIFRRAFASRIFPPDIVAKMGSKHVKGILLHGPPGCGKTLMARKIGKMLSAREPQVVNGPEILNKYVGESEANVRKLFEPAEEEQKRLGKKSGLHIIIFDEIDAVCKQRGASASSGSQVGDTVVNQLLSKIDGVDQLDNILIIGMTNRPDLIDDALLRPGRLEVKKEIQLPNEDGRIEIFKIHTKKMRDNQMLSSDVDLKELAAVTKNFSGAEIEGLTRAAQSYAFTRHTSGGTKVEVNYDTINDIQVCRADFQNALDKDIKPAFGLQQDQFAPYNPDGIKIWGSPVKTVIEDIQICVNQVKNSKRTPFVTCLLDGVTGSGKTALAALSAKNADFPFVKFCAPKDFVGYNESAKSNKIAKIFDDAHKSSLSCIIIDDLERLVEYNPIGPRFSNIIVQTLMVLLKKSPPEGKRLLVLATTSSRRVMTEMGLSEAFDTIIKCPVIQKPAHLFSALEKLESFDSRSLQKIQIDLQDKKSCFVPIKKLIHTVGAFEQIQDKAEMVARFCVELEENYSLQ